MVLPAVLPVVLPVMLPVVLPVVLLVMLPVVLPMVLVVLPVVLPVVLLVVLPVVLPVVGSGARPGADGRGTGGVAELPPQTQTTTKKRNETKRVKTNQKDRAAPPHRERALAASGNPLEDVDPVLGAREVTPLASE